MVRVSIFSTFLMVLAALTLGSGAEAAKFEGTDAGGGDVTISVTLDDGDPPMFSVDGFVRAVDGATVTGGNTNGNPFDATVLNLAPTGQPPGTVLIGGSEVDGAWQDSDGNPVPDTCDISGDPCTADTDCRASNPNDFCGNGCFGDFFCGNNETCFFGLRTDTATLGTLETTGIDGGNGAVLLAGNAAVADAGVQTIPLTNVCFQDSSGTAALYPVRDANNDGIPDECQCGDPNLSGQYESDDLLLTFNCLQQDQAATGVCSETIFKGDTNGTNQFESDDLLAIFNKLQGGTNVLTCDALEGFPLP